MFHAHPAFLAQFVPNLTQDLSRCTHAAPVVRDNLGNTSLTTITQFLDVDDDRRHRETDEKHRIDW
jgi:hypothetical protein